VASDQSRAACGISRFAFLTGGAATLVAAGFDPSLLASLRAGGYVLYFRHGPTDLSQSDTTTDYDDCSRQRNLTASGRTLERRVGVAIRRLAIPIGPVVTDRFCRTRETAQLLFGRYTVDVRVMPNAPNLSENLRRLLATPPPTKLNTAIVAHHNELVASGGPSLSEGEAAVYRPDGAQARLVTQVTPDDWLAAAASSG
jgi:phosphohistidine phosphatase SixA